MLVMSVEVFALYALLTWLPGSRAWRVLAALTMAIALLAYNLSQTGIDSPGYAIANGFLLYLVSVSLLAADIGLAIWAVRARLKLRTGSNAA